MTRAEAFDLAIPSRARRLNPTPVPVADPGPKDHHAQPYFGYAPCVSASGRRRKKHDFSIFTRHGMKCMFCPGIRPQDPL
jgi:hypothetical protein